MDALNDTSENNSKVPITLNDADDENKRLKKQLCELQQQIHELTQQQKQENKRHKLSHKSPEQKPERKKVAIVDGFSSKSDDVVDYRKKPILTQSLTLSSFNYSTDEEDNL